MINLRRRWYNDDYKDTLFPKDYGINFQLSVPQTIADQTWYFGCENVPDELPEGYSLITNPLRELIGHGLSVDVVEALIEWESKNNNPVIDKKVTAVDYFFNEMQRMQYFIGNDLYNAYKEASKMHEEQIQDAYQEGKWDWDEHLKQGIPSKDPAVYYKETFKKDN